MDLAIDRSELAALDAVETASKIRAGDLAPVEVVRAAIDRSLRLDPQLNAVPSEAYEAACATAERPLPGPFSGVPTFVKALDDVAGCVNDHGSRAFADNVARRTEKYVARMLATGLVSLGRSAAPEIGLSGTTEPLAHGPTRNPWNTDHSTGGSSGGAAALVTSRVVPLAHASDAGGSIRIPASSCGLVGLKPSRGRGLGSTAANLLPIRVFTYGAVTRSVRDTAHFTAALEERTPATRLPPIGLVEHPAKERLRIGLYTDSPLGGEVHPDVREATRAAGRACADLGHEVDEIRCPYPGYLLEDIWVFFGYLASAVILQTRVMQGRGYDPSRFEPWTRGLSAHARWRDSIGVVRRLRASAQTSQRLFETYDVLLCPTLAAPAPRIGELAPDVRFELALPRQMHHICFTPIQNATGDPALSLPMGRSRGGLPIGVQFAAAPGQDARLLALAFELEAAGAFQAPS